MLSTSSVHADPGASLWATSSAPAAVSRPIGRCASTARIEGWSISSSIEGRSRLRIATTASAAAVMVGKAATSVAPVRCAGTSLRIARVTMPSVPSLPTNSLSSDSPATSLIRSTSQRHQRAVRQHHVEPEHVVGGDAVLHAAQPARVGGDVAADGADLVRRRVGRIPEAVLGGRGLDVHVEGPGSTTATWQAVSTSIAVIRSRLTTIPPSTALDPPDNPLPAPRGTTGTPCSAAHRTAVCTCSASSARTTATGVPASGSWDLSWRYFSTRSASTTTTPSGMDATSASMRSVPGAAMSPCNHARGATAGHVVA